MDTEILNNAVRYLAKSGVKVENTDEFKKALISLCVTTLVDLGLAINEALDLVMGDGFYQSISDACWEAAQ